MKRFLLPFLAAALCLEQAAALQCYTCEAVTPSSECNFVKNCSEKATACKTTVYAAGIGFPFQGDESITRSCAVECKESNLDEIGLEHPVLCCYKDLCNCRAIDGTSCTSKSPTTGSNGSYTLFAMALVYWAICKTQL
ncbi:ly6/PLAUR domain-containing protein 2-like [Lissotriton helveticus]